jgi:hypothetical protein
MKKNKKAKFITENYFRKFDKQNTELEELAYEIGREVAKLEGHKVGQIDGYQKVHFPWIHDEWDITINEVYVQLCKDWQYNTEIDIVFPVEYLWDKDWKETRKKKEKEQKEKIKERKKENAKFHKEHQKKWEKFLKDSEGFSKKDIKKLWQYRHGLDID